MRIAFIALLLATSAFAQGPSGGATSACGPEHASFTVKLDTSQHTPPQLEPGKAQVYFIQEKGGDTFAATTRVGLDGAWVGVNKNNSYFAVSVEPGEHHVCANVQSFRGHLLGLVHFTAEAGKIYYFDAQIIYEEESKPHLFLAAADSDQATYLIESLPLSLSTPKK
jgi:hypothetical protein